MKQKVEYRYFHIGEEEPAKILLGEKWIQRYGHDVDSLHFHNHLEIGYCHYGKGILNINGTELRYHGGMMTCIPQNHLHTRLSDVDSICYWEFIYLDLDTLLARNLGVKPYYIERIIDRIGLRSLLLDISEYPNLERYIHMILELERKKPEAYLEELRFLCVGFVFELYRMNHNEFSGQELNEKNALVPALEYINQHFDEEIRIEQLARLCHMSETHFRRCFQHIVKNSPIEYINRIRIHNACSKILKESAPIGQIAQQCGFTTISTFNRNFIRYMGVPPKEWRKGQNHFEHKKGEYEIKTEKGW